MKQNDPIVLADLLDEQNEYAVGNEEGRAIFQKLSKIVDNHPGRMIFGISLKGIKFTDASFPRESVISLAKLHRAEKGFYLQDFASKDLLDNWDYAAKAKDQPMIVWDGDNFYLLGPKMGQASLEILNYINRLGEATTAKVAAEFDLTSQNASGKLKKMYNQGLILGSKEVADSGGLEFVYRAIK